MSDMTTSQRSDWRDAACPDLQDWCGYVDGTATADRRQHLADHLASCDRCFSTVAGLRQDLGYLEDEVSAPVAVSSRGHWVYAAAASLVLAWVGWSQLAQVGVDTMPATDGVLGFAASGPTVPLRAPVHLRLVSAAYAGQPPPALPTSRFLAARLERACGATVRQLSLRSTVVPSSYQTRLPATAFTEGDPMSGRRRFVAQILRQLDQPEDRPETDGGSSGVTDVVVLVAPGAAGWTTMTGTAHETLVISADKPLEPQLCRYLQEAMQR